MSVTTAHGALETIAALTAQRLAAAAAAAAPAVRGVVADVVGLGIRVLEFFGIDLAEFPNIARINAACMQLPAFDAARPEKQADAPAST